MSELAFNVNGEMFEVPPLATAWRVRRVKPKGAPEVVYGRDGLPLILGLDAGLEDLRKEAVSPGRYRLDAVDDRQRPVAEAPAAYVYVHEQEPAAAPALVATSRADDRGMVPDSMLLEAMRMNTALAQSVIERFPAMMESAAVLLRAADGAGLPARLPLAVAPDGDGEDDEGDGSNAPAAGFDLQGLVAQVVPPLVMALTSGRLKVPPLSSLVDWRKAAENGQQARAVAVAEPHATSRSASGATTASRSMLAPGTAPGAPSVAVPGAAVAPSEDAPEAMPPLDPATMGHFLAVQQALSLEEGALAQGLAAELSPAELRAWLAELAPLSVSDAVDKIREVLHGAQAQNGAVS
jgi:hypothetical protein